MRLRIITGMPGTGKTRQMLSQIRAAVASADSSAASLYYIVPEQFSLASERLLLDALSDSPGLTACTAVQVLSFTRLTHRLFMQLGRSAKTLACETTSRALLAQAVYSVAEELQYYRGQVGRMGFNDLLFATITDLFSNRVSRQDLRDLCAAAPGRYAKKLADISVMFDAFLRTCDEADFLPGFRLFDSLCDALASKASIPLLDGASVWLDGFSGFSVQEFAVIEQIMRRASSVTIALSTCENFSGDVPYTIERLEGIAQSVGGEIQPRMRLDTPHRFSNPQIAALADALCGVSLKNPPPDSGHVRIVMAQNLRSCAEYAADRILELVGDGYEFSQIAVLAPQDYDEMLEIVFRQAGVPLFMDREVPLAQHTLPGLILAALNVANMRFGMASVMEFAKNPLSGLHGAAADVLENYVLARGISGGMFFLEADCSHTEEARASLVNSLGMYKNVRSETPATVLDHTKRIYEMLDESGATARLAELAQNEQPERGRLHSQVWTAVADMFDKIVSVLGSQQITHEQFYSIVQSAIQGTGLGRIPPTVNDVLLGDCSRTRYPKIRAMICLGANEGKLPPPPISEGLFTDAEGERLAQTLGLPHGNQGRMSALMHGVCVALCQPCERLEIVYTTAPKDPPAAYIVKQLSAALALRPITAKTEHPKALHASAQLAPLLNKTHARNAIANLERLPITRLEDFAVCPQMHFMRHTLRAMPRRYAGVDGRQAGIVLHDALNGFVLSRMSGQPYELVAEDGQDVAQRKIASQAAASIKALAAQMDAGNFSPIRLESDIALRLENGSTAIGRADRIDVCPGGFLSVLDYKTGRAGLSDADIQSGTRLQLALYMAALLEENPDFMPGGMFYFGVAAHIIDTDNEISDEEREQRILRLYRLKGLVNEAAVQLFDNVLAPGLDSDIVPVKLNKDGSPSKSSRAISADTFFETLECAKRVAKQLAERMASGEIYPRPTRQDGRLHCDFCAFAGGCGVET